MDTDYVGELIAAYGMDATPEQCSLLLRHLDLVIERNKEINLTRIDSVEDGLVLHVLDSLLAAPSLLKLLGEQPVSFVDIGTGAGFPGIPLAVMTPWHGTLIDSVGKKTDSVSMFIDKLGLDSRLEARHLRAEELARSNHASYRLVVSRAVAQTNVLLEYASPLLQTGGYFAAYKGLPSCDELDAAGRAASMVGMRFVSRETFELPNEMGHREILIYERVGRAKLKLPRQNGLARRSPLGM